MFYLLFFFFTNFYTTTIIIIFHLCVCVRIFVIGCVPFSSRYYYILTMAYLFDKSALKPSRSRRHMRLLYAIIFLGVIHFFI